MLTSRSAAEQQRDVLAADQDLPRRSPISSPAIRRSVVVLPQPDGPEQRHQRAGLDGEGDVVDRGHRAVALADVRNSTEAARWLMRIHAPVTPAACDRRRRPRRGGRAGARRPATWMQQDRDQHHDDQHRRIGDREAELAGLDAADDVGRRQVVFGGDEEDHRAHRRHGAHEAVDQRGDDRRAQQRQDHAPQRRERSARRASARPRRGSCRSGSRSRCRRARRPACCGRRSRSRGSMPVPVSSIGGTLKARM